MKKIIAILISLTMILALVLGCGTSALAVEKGPAIATQPKNVTVDYPNGATFTVVPQNPAEVESYQWYYVDSVGREFKLDGTSATTSTLVCPTIYSSYNNTCFFCVLKGKNGEYTVSDDAYITVTNVYDDVKALYVGNYAVKRGETLDLSKTELGSGKISYAENGKSITLDNVNFDNTNAILDHTISDAVAFTLDDYATDIDSLDIILKGKNTIKNTFYQDYTNGSGITFDLYFIGKAKGECPPVHVKGGGSLNLVGGTIQLRTNGDLYLEAPVSFNGYNGIFCDGANGYNVIVGENVPLNFDVNGTLIFADKTITLKEGSSVNAKTSAPHVMNEYTYKNGFLCNGDVTLNKAKLDIELVADPDRFIPYEMAIDSFMGINTRGDVIIKDSSVNIKQTSKQSRYDYFYMGGGIYCNNLKINNSNVSVNINSTDIIEATAVTVKGDADISDSRLNMYVKARERIFGMAVTGKMAVKNSTVTAECESIDDEAYGIMFKTVDIDLNHSGEKVSAKVNKGFAMGANIGRGEEKLSFDDDYKPTAYTFGKHTLFKTPADAALNNASMKMSSGSNYIYIETPYSLSNKSEAVKEAVISTDIVEPSPSPKTGDKSYMSLMILVAFGSAFAVIKILKHKFA